ncbi:MAG: hypothetical protein AAF649_04965 [Verrucomicrobiota bacterium]
MKNVEFTREEPSVIKWVVKFAGSAGLAGMLCCVAPALLFLFGIMGGVYAISFANFFYAEDGSAASGAWILRIIAIGIGAYGIYKFRTRQNQCSIDPKRKQKNLILVISAISVIGVGVYLTLEKTSAWYFDKYIVPAQQQELATE